jgi:hypothetical protein
MRSVKHIEKYYDMSDIGNFPNINADNINSPKSILKSIYDIDKSMMKFAFTLASYTPFSCKEPMRRV